MQLSRWWRSGTQAIEDRNGGTANGVFLPETRLFLPHLYMADRHEETFAKKHEGTAVSCQQKQKKRRTCARRCRRLVSLSSSRSLVVIIEFAILLQLYDRSGCGYKPHGSIRTSFRSRSRVYDRTTARPHDRTTARPHDRTTTARPHDRTTTTSFRGVSH